MHYKYILILTLEKIVYLFRDFNPFYEEGYVKFSVSENSPYTSPTFAVFSCSLSPPPTPYLSKPFTYYVKMIVHTYTHSVLLRQGGQGGVDLKFSYFH